MVKNKLRKRIIKELLTREECAVSELALHTAVSRVSISKELQYLCDKGIAQRNAPSRNYMLSPKIAFVIFKLYEHDAEMVAYSLDKSVCKRQRLDFIYSLSYEENVTFLSQNAQKYRNMLENKFEQVFSCIIYDKSIDFAHAVPRRFKIKKSRASLMSEYLANRFTDETVLYLNAKNPMSLLCRGGKPICKPMHPDTDLSQPLKSALSLLKPCRIVLEGKKSDEISRVCEKSNVLFSFIEPDSHLYTDEIELLTYALYENCK